MKLQRLNTHKVMSWLNTHALVEVKTYYVKEDQGINLLLNLNIAVSTYCIMPFRATGFSPFVLLYDCEAVTPYEIQFTRYTLKEQY